MRSIYHIDKETGELVEGYPPYKFEVYSEAPMFISDTMNPTRHPMTGTVVESRRMWQDIDKATGCMTTSTHVPPKSKRQEWLKASSEERKKAMLKSIAQLDAGTAPLNEEQRELCRIQNDIVSDALNFNAHDVIGRKNSDSGKRYRRKYKR